MSDALFECDNDWQLVLLNQAARAVIGRAGGEPDSAIGRTVWEVFPALVGSPVHERILRLAEDRSAFRTELQGPYSRRWFSLYAFPTRVGIGVFTSDITEQKISEQNAWYLAESSKLLGSSLDLAQTLSNVASLLVPERADACTIDLIGDDGRLSRVATAGVDHDREERLREWRSNIPTADRTGADHWGTGSGNDRWSQLHRVRSQTRARSRAPGCAVGRECPSLRRGRECAPRSRGGKPGKVGLPAHDESRAADATQCHRRLHRAARKRGAWTHDRRAAPGHAAHSHQPAPSARADQ